MEELTQDENRIAKAVLDAAFVVHSRLGPGLLEHVYEICLMHELQKAGYEVSRQTAVSITYDRIVLEAGFRMDLVVANKVIVECKAVDVLHPVATAQVFTYLKLTGLRLGLLINFNVKMLQRGIRRVICSEGASAASQASPT
jgi:GxxExxY protein